MQDRWRIELFGGLRALCGDREISRFRSQKTGALLGYLARHADRMHPREALVEVFWPGSEPQQGRASLSTALCSLRRQLEPPGEESGNVVVADRNAVKLNPDAITTDVADFMATIEATRGAGEPRGQELREEAVDIYKGEFLAGYYEDWVLDEQRQLAEQFHQALSELLSILENADDLHRAVEYAMRGVKADPLREEAHRELIRLHVAAGRPEMALQRYRELEQLFARELDASPTPGTRSLLEQIERHAGRSAAPAAPAPPPLPTSRSLPEAGTFTVLFADRGAKQRRAALPKSLRRELSRHLRKHGGVEVGEDSILTVAFGVPESALACAVAMHRAFGAGGSGRAGKPLRLALDAGPLELEGDGYRGAVLEQGPRVLRAGHVGEILCSERAAALASLEPDPGIILRDLGLYRLTKRSAPERLFRAEYAEMAPTDFAPPDALSGHQGRVPTPLTRLVGRGKELSRLHDLLAGDGARLVTVLGPSGIGKTRVALAAAKLLLDVFEGAVWYVSLAEVAEPGQVPAAVLRTVRPSGEPGGEPLLQAAEALDAQASLLVLDNFEHLLPDGAELIRELLERVP
ncbi:winged helix-turn-helix domain-containing protein, partial [PVC group bacterium]|nr:winged helix-turn-helix domain-containing protein [PVC group bacterium]